MSSAYFTLVPPRRSLTTLRRTGQPGIDSTARHSAQERQRARLVEIVVEVAALRALHARWAAALARTAVEHADRVGDPALELLEAALRDSDAAGVPVVDEDGRQSGIRVDIRREAADVPAIAHRPEREEGDHRMLGGVQRREQRRHRLESLELARGRDVPDRFRIERGRRQVERDRGERRLVTDLLL